MYIFGYGSLINSASRQLTGQTGQAIPVVAHGLVRCWGKIDDSYVLSPLVVNIGQGKVNGVLLEIDEFALAEFDHRERGYERISISANQIETEHAFNPQLPIWVYVKDSPQPPCVHSPIVQTYVDTVLAGCLEFSESFAHHFVEHTLGWQHPLENDRHDPKYGNLAGVQPSHHSIIDDLIAKVR
ncbi:MULTISPECIES: gamma-glutamylcyclotransferase family protein [Vibrio]|uniref:Gamma-glutamylcyclotransferase n=1 Tax=Vibrio aestuarianus TaxID=28171 RepID=A0ABM9FNT6_9VIBR|nr:MULTISPECIES: gamma-glutamylcyclotransferase family protein [Vibrio]MBD1565010.1 gamma-glutamylcyclotransferase [Vibrio sp. S12_S33]MDE1209868.1 gamma-glutamylcyclotransferase [Vibrio aestuarianus]MDE1212809.1 gamma-glutamylcyclotransferase [Vibrio aestuarianus]MDE1216103.1 gamma-glutamylcyclotransferase [Vibrio aestuarianus]MDE1221006.1 gamma-glutamylcyclotransferase [Vibrio aestuarianus]